MPRPIKPRLCRRRLQGQRLLALVSNYDIPGNGIVSVTAARRLVSDLGLVAPAIINVRRNDYTVDHFFLAEKGVFGLGYVEFNWMLFPCLKELAAHPNNKQIFADMNSQDWASEEESYRPEYAFI